MTKPRKPFLGWAGWAHLRYTALLSVAQFVWFAFVYLGSNWITTRRQWRVPIHFSWELEIPFVPAMLTVYSSIYLLFAAAPFVLQARLQIRALVLALAFVTTVAGVCFLFVPADLAFSKPAELGKWSQFYHFTDRLNLDHNLLPSLHVTMSVVCLAAFAQRATLLTKCFLWLWALAMAAATVLAHQHHVLDAVTGFALGLAGFAVYHRLASSAPVRGGIGS